MKRIVHRASTCSRGGYLYVAVMMVSLLVSIIGMTALQLAHNGLRTAADHSDFAEAASLARTAVEFAKNHVDRDSGWRTTYANDTPSAATPHGRGTFSWKLVDDDGNLADDATDSVWIVGTGTVGAAVFSERVRLVPAGSALDCLGASLCSNGSLSVPASTTVHTDQFVHTNGSLSVGLLSSLAGDAHASGSISGTVDGAAVASATSRTMPGSDAFDYYLDHGTRIDVDSLPGAGLGLPRIDSVVLSPSLNPYGGGTNREGIYVLDCEGKNLTVRDCRIVGTLVVLNPGQCETSSTIHWEPAVPHYPALLVQGDLRIRHSYTGSLSESSLGTNFNPTGAPHHGTTDSDTSDAYPSRIRGLVYASGTLTYPTLTPTSLVDGCVVANAVNFNSGARFEFSDVYLNHPPPGFRHGTTMEISPGSWERVVAP